MLVLQVKVELNATRTHVVTSGDPLFVLYDLEEIRPSSGRSMTDKLHITFGKSEWSKIVASGGDIESALSITLEKHKPLANFKKLSQ